MSISKGVPDQNLICLIPSCLMLSKVGGLCPTLYLQTHHVQESRIVFIKSLSKKKTLSIMETVMYVNKSQPFFPAFLLNLTNI